MVQIQLINNLIAWERKLELNEERRKHHRSDPYVNFLAAPQICRTERANRKDSQASADLVKALNANW